MTFDRASEEAPGSVFRSDKSCCYPTEATVMTVRRYSTNCSLTGVSERERGPDGARRGTPTAGWGRLQEDIRLQDNVDSTCPPGEEDAMGSRSSLQEYVHKNRFI